MGTKPASVVTKWTSGDHIYGAVRQFNVPAGTAHLFTSGREYPVAQLSTLGGEYFIQRWVSRTERFPEPIKGFNS